MLRRAAPALVLLTALAVSSCSSDEPDPPASPATPSGASGTASAGADPIGADDLRAGIAALYAGTDPAPEESAESGCFADALLERLDADRLAAAGIVADGAVVPVLPVLDAATAGAWVEAQEECVDFVEVSARAVGAQSKGKVDATTYAACLRREVDEQQVHDALVDALSGGLASDAVRVLGEAQATCVREASPPE